MKKNHIFRMTALFVITLFYTVSLAQETTLQTSTAATPIWYTLNAAGSANANTALAHYTSVALGEIIKGDKPVSPATILPTQNQDKYLWRFESDGGGNVSIVNKMSGARITNPTTATSTLRFSMSTVGSLYIPTAVAAITSNNVTGTAFYFMPTDAVFSAVGRINCDGTSSELVLYRPAASGTGDIGSGGKGSLYWLRLVPMKSVTVSVASSNTGVGMATIMKDDAQNPEEVMSVSKAQSIGVTLIASANTGSKFVAWRNKTTLETVSTSASFTYSGTSSIDLEAVFSISTGVASSSKSKLSFYPNPCIDIVTCSAEVTNTILYNSAGQIVLHGKGNCLNVSKLPVGEYILTLISENLTEKQVLIRR